MTAPVIDKFRVKELRGNLETKTAEIQRVSDTFDIDDQGNVEVSTEKATEFKSLVAQAREIRELLEAAQGVSDLRAWMDQPAGASSAAAHAAQVQSGMRERKSLGEQFLASEAYLQRDRNRPSIQFETDGNIHEFKDIYGGGQTPTGGNLSLPALGGVQNIGITEQRLRSKHVRDLFPKATTTASVLFGVVETGFTNNAAQLSQRTADNSGFTTKPHSDLTLAPQQYNIGRIAHWIKAHKDMLSDEPRLKDFINRRMTDGIALAEDRDILWGTGGAERVTGIMETPGIQQYTGLSSDKFTKQLRKAATRCMLAEFDPTGVVCHPMDWETLELEETTDGHYRIAINIAIGGTARVWGMDIIATTAMTQGRYLLGAFGMGAQIYDREKVNVAISTENEADFIQNLVTVRAEERVCVVTERPESFVAGTLTTFVP
jgi:HK97 family phage major capsid protein